MMNILIPMAGAGQRFVDAGYKLSKPLIPVTDRYTAKTYPMVAAAVNDIIRAAGNGKITFVYRNDKESGISSKLSDYFPDAEFIGIDHLTEGQACTCLLAKNIINTDTPLFIGGCDNGMAVSPDRFSALSENSDVLVFTYRHNDCVLSNPNAYGWVKADENGAVSGVSVKKAIPDDPMNDHAIVSSFWFRKGSDFVRCAEEMIASDDRINGEFYVDKVIDYCVAEDLRVKVLEVDKYICWGTPADYENYEKTVHYWKDFINSGFFMPNKHI